MFFYDTQKLLEVNKFWKSMYVSIFQMKKSRLLKGYSDFAKVT